jgi:hypothetical protein
MALTYSQELLDRATAYVGQAASARRYDAGLTEITDLYTAITGQAVGKCRQCQYSDYLAVVQAYIRQATRELHPETMPESNYTLAPGLENETFVHESYGKAVTGANMNDDDAKFFISKGFDKAFVLKSSQKPTADGSQAETETQADQPQPSAREAELEKEVASGKQALETEKEAHLATKKKAAETLKGEKEAHKATKNEVTALASKLADTEQELKEAQAELEKLRNPTTEPTIPTEPAA